MLKKLLEIFNVFFKVGVIGFGGGSALIPVIEKEVVEKKKWFTDEEYLKHTVIGNITPGTLPTKLGAIAGYELAGGVGSFIGAFAGTLPGIFFTLLLMMLFTMGGTKITHYIEFASVGISVFIISLLVMYIVKVISSGKQNGLYQRYLMICIASFLVTAGKEIRHIINSLIGKEGIGNMLFDIATIDLIIIAFFMILFVGLVKNKKTIFIGILISVIYAFLNGKHNFIPNSEIFSNVMLSVMIILAIGAIKYNSDQTDKIKVKIRLTKEFYVAIGLFIGMPLLLLLLAILMVPVESGITDILNYTTDVTISTMTSFGGGEAYVAVADGFFVQTGLVDPGDFYNKLVAVANALPGPILVKIAAGVGYIFGGSMGGILYGWIIALLGMALAVGSCCILALIVLMGYDALKDAEALTLLKTYILPVVCGMLISTSLSMIFEAMKITAAVGIAGGVALPSMAIGVGVLYAIHKRYHINDIILLIACAAISFGTLNIF